MFIDDFRIYKVSGGNYPPPWDLAGEGLGNEAALTWADMNASGTANYQFDNDAFNNGIQMSTEGSTAFAGTEITLAGTSNVSTVSIFNIGNPGDETTIAGFGTNGTLYSNDVLYSEDVVLQIQDGMIFKLIGISAITISLHISLLILICNWCRYSGSFR